MDINEPIDVLKPITTRSPLPTFEPTSHPLKPLSIHEEDLNKPIQTNKFYSNFYLGYQKFPAYLDPYVLTWRPEKHSGIAVGHTDDDKKVFGPGDPPRYFFNPVGIHSIIFSAEELSDASLTLSSLDQMSVNITVSSKENKEKKIEFPAVKGMAYITAIYYGVTPLFDSVVGFKEIEKVEMQEPKCLKFTVTLYDGKRWLIYVFQKEEKTFELEIKDKLLKTTGVFDGVIQVTKIPTNNSNAESILDKYSGVYPKSITLSAFASDKSGSYTFLFNTNDKKRLLLHYALYHHYTSFDKTNAPKRTDVFLPSPTNGMMIAYIGNSWTMIETDLPVEIDFFPYMKGKVPKYSEEALGFIKDAAIYEISEDFQKQIDPNSIYFSGKVFSKLSLVCFVAKYILKDDKLANECIEKLKKSFLPFIKNENEYKLVYDSTWKGIVTNQGFTKGPLADFGASYYNDHHYHYGYMIFVSAIIGYIDQSWIIENKDWVIDLIRDVANPTNDKYFPPFRSFDWFVGHSWSKGLFESADGKDEESSSEDYNFYYAMKLFGLVINDASMVARANLILAIMKRSLHSYILYESSNTVMPKIFLPNYVSGIKFMNKVDHTTYFSARTECIQGIHMIPITSLSSYFRTPEFVKSEWDDKLASIICGIHDGWKGILYANLAISDPKKSYCFFSGKFNRTFLDNGSSLAWYLVFSSAFANQ